MVPAPEAPDELSRLEIATGLLFGAAKEPPSLPRPRSRSALETLEAAILPALLRPPCVVSFSGGRDSSTVLAAAVSLARREGLDPPVPATNVFPAIASADEHEWQERVIAHLRIDEWLRLSHTNELDVIGPFAQRVLRAHGLLWPCNVHFHLPFLELASGGSLLTGIGGDELFGASCRPPASTLRLRTAIARPRDAVRLALSRAPRRLRRSALARRHRVDFAWLRPRAIRVASAQAAAEEVAEPRRLVDRLAWWQTLRYMQVGGRAIDQVASDEDVQIVHPLMLPELWAVAGREAAPAGFSGRTEGMRRLFGELLPEEIISRSSKAHFDEIFWTDRSRAFVAGWDGSGVPEEWVERSALAEQWGTDRPLAQSFTLLQSAWLAADFRDRVEQQAEPVRG